MGLLFSHGGPAAVVVVPLLLGPCGWASAWIVERFLSGRLAKVVSIVVSATMTLFLWELFFLPVPLLHDVLDFFGHWFTIAAVIAALARLAGSWFE